MRKKKTKKEKRHHECTNQDEGMQRSHVQKKEQGT